MGGAFQYPACDDEIVGGSVDAALVVRLSARESTRCRVVPDLHSPAPEMPRRSDLVSFCYSLLASCTLLSGPAAAQVDTTIVPLEGRTTWAPGVRSGIPERPTICVTIPAAALGNGTVEASAIIRQAIVACPAGQTVQLSAGQFLVNHYILIDKAVTLRGAGPGATQLVKTNGARPYVNRTDDQQPLVVIGANRWPKTDDATSVELSADAEHAAMSVAVADPGGFAPGQIVLLDQDDFTTADWTVLPPRLTTPAPSGIWASDRVVFQRHLPPAPYDDPFPDSLTWFSRPGRPMNELKEVAAVTGSTITFTTPVHASYTRSRRAQLTRYTREHVHVRDAGLEDLTLLGGSDGALRFAAAAYSWAKNVEIALWLGEGVGFDHSFRVEFRDSFIHDAAWPYPGGGGYGISFARGSSEVLVENNTVLNANKVMVIRSCGAGSVVGYNYMDNGYILNTPDWVEVGLNASHMSGSHHVLFEGNQAFNYDSDNTHGNAFGITVFRNHLTGRRRSFTGKSNARGIGLMYGSWWQTFVGNVIGEEGRMGGWIYEDPGDGTYGHATSRWSSTPAVWRLGYDPTRWDQAADPKVKATAVRDGNFDFLTGQVRWDRGARELPPSLYLTSKPAFFGDAPWPWVDPFGATKVGQLPASRRPGIAAPLPIVPTPKGFRLLIGG